MIRAQTGGFTCSVGATKYFTVYVNGTWSGTITMTPSGGGLSTPQSNTWVSSVTPWTFSITPTSTGVVSMALSSTSGWYCGQPYQCLVTSATPAVATAFNLVGPSSGPVNVASTTWTVIANGLYGTSGSPKTVTITPSSGFGLGPIVLTFSGTTQATFTITPTSSRAIVLTPTNNGGLNNPPNGNYYASSSSLHLLAASDFTYLGYYLVPQIFAGIWNSFPQVTCRYEGGTSPSDLRFLVTGYGTGGTSPYGGGYYQLCEMSLPSGSFSGSYTSPVATLSGANITSYWNYTDVFIAAQNNSVHLGMWWEDSTMNPSYSGSPRLWMNYGIDYPGSNNPNAGLASAISVCTLTNGSPGTVPTWNGYWGFQQNPALQTEWSAEGVSQRCVYSCVAGTPSWIQTTFGLGPYFYGFGGSCSNAQSGGTASLGLFAISGPDVSAKSSGSYIYTPVPQSSWSTLNATSNGGDWNIPYSATNIVSDHRNGTNPLWVGGDWYASPGTPATFDGGVRYDTFKNSQGGGFNFGNAFNNGTQTSTFLAYHFLNYPPDPEPIGQWQVPAPDGQVRWAFDDAYACSGCWISGASKYGFVIIQSCMELWTGYVNSTGASGSAGAEIHVFDPADFQAVIAGTKNSWNVQPAAMHSVTSDLNAILGSQHNGAFAFGSCFDPVQKILWIWAPGFGAYTSYLVAYSVNC